MNKTLIPAGPNERAIAALMNDHEGKAYFYETRVIAWAIGRTEDDEHFSTPVVIGDYQGLSGCVVGVFLLDGTLIDNVGGWHDDHKDFILTMKAEAKRRAERKWAAHESP